MKKWYEKAWIWIAGLALGVLAYLGLGRRGAGVSGRIGIGADKVGDDIAELDGAVQGADAAVGEAQAGLSDAQCTAERIGDTAGRIADTADGAERLSREASDSLARLRALVAEERRRLAEAEED